MAAHAGALQRPGGGAGHQRAFGLTQNTIWQLADALDLWRLALAALGSIASPVVWLIADHELWERRSGRAARLGQPIRLYNITIVITVTLGVASLYGALGAGLESDEAVRRAAYG